VATSVGSPLRHLRGGPPLRHEEWNEGATDFGCLVVCGLVVSEGDHGVDVGGAAGGEVAGQQGKGGEEDSDGEEGWGVDGGGEPGVAVSHPFAKGAKVWGTAHFLRVGGRLVEICGEMACGWLRFVVSLVWEVGPDDGFVGS